MLIKHHQLSILSIMISLENIAKLRIHIAPVGFEIDRIVIPATGMKADLVYLLVDQDSSRDKAGPFVKKIKKKLENANIKVSIEKHDRKKLFNIIKTIKKIISKESKHAVYVNLSSGSKLQAIGAMMTVMMFKNNKQDLTPFYAEAEHYADFKEPQESTGIKEMIEIPTYEMHTPKQELIDALKIIKKRKGGIQKKEMVRIAVDNGLISVKSDAKNPEISKYASLDQNIIKPLIEEWKFVKVEKKGRVRYIKLTQEGLDASEFLI